MKTGSHAVVLLLSLFLFFISFRYDFAIVNAVQALRNPVLDTVMLGVTYIGSSIAVLFIFTSFLLWKKQKKQEIIPLWLSLGLAVLASSVLKGLFFRQRPFLFSIDTPDILGIGLLASSSFPSAHAAISFSAVPVLDKEFPRFKWMWIGFAVAVAFSRVYFALHYVSDVLAGALIGYSAGMLFSYLGEKYPLLKKSSSSRIARAKTARRKRK